MAELRHRRGHVMTRRAPRAEERLHCHGPEDDDHPEARQERHLAFQVGLASGELDPRRLVLWRGAPPPGGDVATPGGQALAFRNRRRVIREHGTRESPVERFPPPRSPEMW